MTQANIERDRVESFIEAIDHYTPKEDGFAEIFPLFSRFLSRSIDARYISQHPIPDLLDTVFAILKATQERDPEEIIVKILPAPENPETHGKLIVCLPTQPFITSTIRLALEKLQIKSTRHISTSVPIKRDKNKSITQIGLSKNPKETIFWQDIECGQLQQEQTVIVDTIHARLKAAQCAVNDFPKMRSCLEEIAQHFELKAQKDNGSDFDSHARLLRWMLNEHFVVLGMRSLSQTSVGKDKYALGIGKLNSTPAITCTSKSVNEWLEEKNAILEIRKSQTESWIYRSGHTDHVFIRTLDDKGKPNGAIVVEGLFSFEALAEPPTRVPFLDGISNRIYERLQATKGSHHYRTIRNAFNSLPLEFLFSLSIDHIEALIEHILNAGSQKRTQVDLRYNAEKTFAFLFVALPRQNYSEDLRSELQLLLREKFPKSSLTDGVYAGDKDFVGLHFFLTNAESLKPEEEEKLKQEIDLMASPWIERLENELAKRHSIKKAQPLYALYNDAFSRQYQEQTSVARTVSDINLLEGLDSNNHIDCDIYQEPADAGTGIARIRLFSKERVLLSNILPILDNLGIIAIDQFPANVQVPGRREYFIATFRVRAAASPMMNLLARRNRLRAAIQALLYGAMTNDPLNKLLLAADIPWTYVVLIRAYERYARQLGLPYNRQTYENALLAHPNTVRSMTELFRAKFDPDFEGLSPTHVDAARETAIQNTRGHITDLLGGVTDLTTDQILRVFFNMIQATLRTNFYQRNPLQAYHLALKFNPKKIPTMPEPLPYREILVHHPKVVGLHLRGGQLARGGIRWSDRNLDFRTEVLGLMATQNLKNVLIVPRGAKGAFVLLDPPQDMRKRRKEADELYKVFIQGLLDVTDNLVDGEITKPNRVLSHDPDDAYLVVAADKGTAHLSDTANQVAKNSGFWLNDAFASGGSQGYDHKKEAITARGAWECVKRHFYELEIDPESDPIKVVGIGDMSGDVFGNGMLRSKSIQLIAAFDHRHIFIDPTPDPQKSFDARQTMFDAGHSTWKDYPKELISQGGGVFPRAAKAIALTNEMQAILRTQAKTLSGPDLIQKVLAAPADLLWNGGIGTYIKASSESHHDIGDPANDLVRIDATQIKARVIGEGGNLGISPAGRIELAQNDVKLNTDYIDNSAGVDLSDHEVNLKILFELALKRNELSIAKRDSWLEKVREEVNTQVLQNNWVQSRIISLDKIRSKTDIPRFQRAIEFLCEHVPFKRRDYYLPGERIINERAQNNLGLYRPELAALISNAKLYMRQELISGQAPAFEKCMDEYINYFPVPLIETFKNDILNHPLRNEISNAVLANHIMADTGSCFLSEASILTGRHTSDIIDAFFLAQKFLNISAIKNDINEKLPLLNAQNEYALRLELSDALENMIHWILRRLPPQSTNLFTSHFQECSTKLSSKLPKDFRKILSPEMKLIKKKGMHQDFVEMLTSIRSTSIVLDACALRQKVELSDETSMNIISAIGKALELNDILYLSKERQNPVDKPAKFAIKDLIRRQIVTLAENLVQKHGAETLQHPSTRKWLRELQQEFKSLHSEREELSGLVISADRLQRHLYALHH